MEKICGFPDTLYVFSAIHIIPYYTTLSIS